MSNKNRIVFYIFAGVGALIVAAWLLTYPLPVRREMMLDSTLSFLLTIVLTGLLWWTSRQSTNARTFWTLLASGWTLNLVGNAAWGASRMVTGKSVPLFGWIDAIYIARYILVFAAFWRCLDRLGRRWVDLVVVIAIAIVVAWLGVFWPKMTSPDVELSHILDFLSGAIYPIVDAALIYLAILAWARAAERPKRPLGLLAQIGRAHV